MTRKRILTATLVAALVGSAVAVAASSRRERTE